MPNHPSGPSPLYPFEPNGPSSKWMPPEIDPPHTWQNLGTKDIIYRFYAADGALLYIGVTGWSWGGPIRWGHHKRSAQWWPLAAQVSVEVLPRGCNRENRERLAIRAEKPRFNKQHNLDRRGPNFASDDAPSGIVVELQRYLTPDCFAALVAAFQAEPDSPS